MTPLTKITERLIWLLRLHGKRGAKVRRMTYSAHPLTTALKFEGTPLRSVMSPPVPDDPFACERIFDTWLTPLLEGTGSSVKDLTDLAGEALSSFITLEGTGRSPTFQEATVRLLYALGNANGACLVYSPRSIEVFHGERTFGVTDGIVSSRFCEGMDLKPFNPVETLERVEQIRTFNPYFCQLYREAHRRGKGLPEALIALHMGNPDLNWRRMAEKSRPDQQPSKAKFRQWENILLKRADPILVLYTALVPLWITSAEFGKAIGRLATRPIDPSATTRQLCITRLHTYFHKNK
jgi:hypothetical protein